MKKIVFFGTPPLTTLVLETLQKSGYTPSLVVTQEDKPVGRKQILTPPEAKTWARGYDISVLQPQKMKDIREVLESEDWDLFVVAAYGKILPRWLLDIPKYGTINLHYSLLPEYRGASPVQSALLRGDTSTGITIQKVVYELDAGDILYQEKVIIEDEDTFPVLLEKLNLCACEALPNVVSNIFLEDILPTPQDHTRATFCTKIEKTLGEIVLSINSETNKENWYKYKAFYSWPGVYFFQETHEVKIRIKVTEAEFKNGIFTPIKVIPEGKKEIQYTDFVHIYQDCK